MARVRRALLGMAICDYCTATPDSISTAPLFARGPSLPRPFSPPVFLLAALFFAAGFFFAGAAPAIRKASRSFAATIHAGGRPWLVQVWLVAGSRYLATPALARRASSRRAASCRRARRLGRGRPPSGRIARSPRAPSQSRSSIRFAATTRPVFRAWRSVHAPIDKSSSIDSGIETALILASFGLGQNSGNSGCSQSSNSASRRTTHTASAAARPAPSARRPAKQAQHLVLGEVRAEEHRAGRLGHGLGEVFAQFVARRHLGQRQQQPRAAGPAAVDVGERLGHQDLGMLCSSGVCNRVGLC